VISKQDRQKVLVKSKIEKTF